MEGDDEFWSEPEREGRCPEDCPNAAAPYCPLHEDPSIYKRDENILHMVEASAANAARELVVNAVNRVREKRHLKEVRVPTRQMDEWLVFSRQVVLDSGEHTAEGELERKVAEWLDKMKEQDWAQLDRLKERYMRFTGDVAQQKATASEAAASQAPTSEAKAHAEARKPEPRKPILKRPSKAKRPAYYDTDASDFFEDG